MNFPYKLVSPPANDTGVDTTKKNAQISATADDAHSSFAHASTILECTSHSLIPKHQTRLYVASTASSHLGPTNIADFSTADEDAQFLLAYLLTNSPMDKLYNCF